MLKRLSKYWLGRLLPLIVFGAYLQAAEANNTGQHLEQWQFEREQYQAAMTALSQGRISQFKEIGLKLSHYPLYPYLEYAYLQRLIKRKTPASQVSAFLKAYSDTPLAPRVKHLWLRTLAKRGDWQRYLEFYNDDIQSVELQCYGLWAMYKTGLESKALDLAEPLWLVGRSQPKACDPVFKLWQDRGRLTDKLAWQRFSMALQSGNTRLARYLIRFMSKGQQQQARLYRELHFRPDKLDVPRFSKLLDEQSEELTVHAIQRLARKDAKLAQILWRKYQEQHHFNKIQIQQTDYKIIQQLARQNHTNEYIAALQQYSFPNSTHLLEVGIEMAIRQQQWDLVLKQLQKLPEPTLQTERWQYWFARATEQSPDNTVQRTDLLTALAKSRSYYGFLAADWLNIDYQLNAESYPVDGNFLEQLKINPGIERAKELWLLGSHTDARREWIWVSRRFTKEQHYTAAYHAHQLGWHSQAISSAVSAERWHDLQLRFPLVYRQSINQAAKNRQLNANWLFALARQESAMSSDAQSPKGALGLMQLMPGTAAMVSKQHNLQYRSTRDLLDPGKSVEIGSHYIKDLLNRFNGNSIHATAAYNAGPNRVSAWLKNKEDMPIDIWIESIPYSETRQYVKNVLAYSVIFAKLQNQSDFYMPTANYLTKRATALAAVTVKPEK